MFIVSVVAPVLHVYESPPLAVSTVLPPEQIFEVPEMVATGKLGFELTMAVATEEHPLLSVTVTEYEPGANPVAV